MVALFETASPCLPPSLVLPALFCGGVTFDLTLSRICGRPTQDFHFCWCERALRCLVLLLLTDSPESSSPPLLFLRSHGRLSGLIFRFSVPPFVSASSKAPPPLAPNSPFSSFPAELAPFAFDQPVQKSRFFKSPYSLRCLRQAWTFPVSENLMLEHFCPCLSYFLR